MSDRRTGKCKANRNRHPLSFPLKASINMLFYTDMSQLYTKKPGSVVHPTFYKMGTGGKAAGA
jgi:hypothetical protein